MRIYVRVTEVISSNRTFEEQLHNVWKGSGILRISVAHHSKHCRFLNSAAADKIHSKVIELPLEWLEHEAFYNMGTCWNCWRGER